MQNKRFTKDGSSQFEGQLRETCAWILQQVQAVVPAAKLEGLVLGGGYGRGEGGVLQTLDGERPYNDLEFYVFTRGLRLLDERAYGRQLRDLGEQLSPRAGLHVEFKVDSLRRMRRSAVSLYSYDLVSAHHIIWGNRDLFDGCEKHLDAGVIPLSEAARLLLNRCSGLLLAKEILSSGSGSLSTDEADFIGRNLAKAQLCLGDAVLAANGSYHWSCLERQKRLAVLTPAESLEWLEQIRRHHLAGVEFKLHPQRISKPASQFAAECADLSELALAVWLWVENRRLGCRFKSIREYAFNQRSKWPGAVTWKNYLLNLKTFGPRAALTSLSWRYPRERLLNSLALLLWDHELPPQPEVAEHLQRQLATNAVDWSSFVAAYKQIWPLYG